METSKSKLDIVDILYKYGTILTTIAIILFFSITTKGRFLQFNNVINILRAMSVTAIIAIGVTMSVVVGGFDLSAGSVASLSMAVVMAMFVWYGMGLVPAILLGIIVAVLVGLLNSLIIIKFKVPDMLATLANLFIINGVATTFAKGKIISINMIMPDGSTSKGVVPEVFKSLGQVPIIIVIMVIVVLLMHVFLNYTKHGRYMYVVGGNPEAAKLSGVKITKYKTLAYVLAALFAGIGGILLAARMGQANPSAGAGYLMESVAAAYIGFSLGGLGKANAMGTFVGALLMVSLANGLVMLSVPYYAMDIIKGSVLVLALILTYYKQK